MVRRLETALLPSASLFRSGRGVGHAERRAPEGLERGAGALGDPLAAAYEELHGAGPPPFARDLGQPRQPERVAHQHVEPVDRKSTRLNSSHSQISYAVFCL